MVVFLVLTHSAAAAAVRENIREGEEWQRLRTRWNVMKNDDLQVFMANNW
jgi:hypothetical protein